MKDCLRLHYPRAKCAVCGEPATHMPLKVAGFYCDKCCVVCNATVVLKEEPPADVRRPRGAGNGQAR